MDPDRMAVVIVEDAALRIIRENPGVRADELHRILVRERVVGATFAALTSALRELQLRGEIESSEGGYWTDCECWGRVRHIPANAGGHRYYDK